LFVSALVNAPRTWPKSSESSSVSDSAPQLSATNGRSLRAELKWMARATSSFPVPDSPDQHRAAGRGNRLHQLEDRQHRLARADDVRELVRGLQRPLHQDVFLLQPLAVELLADAERQFVAQVRRLLDIVGRAETQRLQHRLLRAVRRHHDDAEGGVQALRLAQQIDAGDLRHPDVGDDQVEASFSQRVERRPAVIRGRYVISLTAKCEGQHLPHRRLIVHDEHPGGRCRRHDRGRRRIPHLFCHH